MTPTEPEETKPLEKLLAEITERESKATPGSFVPAVIYLQYYGDGEPDDESPVRDNDVTWCRDKIFESDIKYVRSRTDIPRLVAAVRRAAKYIDAIPGHSAQWGSSRRALKELTAILSGQDQDKQKPDSRELRDE
jgi:hypothetical protein